MNAVISAIIQATHIELGIELLQYPIYIKHFLNLSMWNF